METEEAWRARVARCREEIDGRDDQLVALRAQLDDARRALAEAERRAAESAGELRALQAGLAWRALSSYRQVARRVAPAGSRRGNAYDRAVGAARSSLRRLRRADADPPEAVRATEGQGATGGQGATQAAVVPGPPAADTWFRDHYETAAKRVIEFLAVDGISLEGKQVADIGAGDGILDLGLAHKARPARLVGFDVNPEHLSTQKLLEFARHQGVGDSLPDCLEFRVSGPARLPAEDRSFDAVITWSAFEHIADPLAVLREVRRVLRDDGALFLQLWPFYHSQFGSHLRDWFPEGWEHLEKPAAELEAAVRSSERHDGHWIDIMVREFRELNRITVDDLGAALVEAGFGVRRLQLLTRRVPLPPEPAARIPLSVLGIEGVELTAVPLPA